MPYKANILPEPAQSIYREAFNYVWKNYKNPEKRRGNASREITTYRVAWSAVEKRYIKSATGE